MYDPDVVETFIRVYRDIEVGGADAPQHREVMQRVTQSRHDAGASHDLAPEVAGSSPGSPLAFFSLSRMASGEACVGDVPGPGSSRLARSRFSP